MSTEFLTIDDVSALLQVPVGTLRHWRVAGYGPPAIRPGKRLIYRRVDLDAWINEQFDQLAG